MTKAQTLEALGNQLDSFYSLEQVIKIVESIEENSYLTSDQIEKVLNELENTLAYQNNNNRLIDYDTAEFSLCGNEISLESVDIDTDVIVNHAREAFEQLLED